MVAPAVEPRPQNQSAVPKMSQSTRLITSIICDFLRLKEFLDVLGMLRQTRHGAQ